MKALSFEGSGLEYFKIWIVNLLLTIVTLSLYYPWAKVRTKRYFYANSILEGRNFEYHATGKQLFVGYLIALAIFLAYVVIQQVSVVGGAIVFLIFILALPWIIWRSHKFNMRVTSFSNVRFGFDGLLGGAYINYLLLPILFFVALYVGPIAAAVSGGMGLLILIMVLVSWGLAFYLFAYIKKRNASYTINGLRYGQGEFSTDVETKGYAAILGKTIGFSILAIIIYMVIMGLVAAMTVGVGDLLNASGSTGDPEVMSELMSGGMVAILGLVYFGLIAIAIIVGAYSYTRQRTYLFANSQLDGQIDFASPLKARSLAWVSVTNFIVIILTLSFGIPWAKVRMARLLLENTEVDTSSGFEDYITRQEKEESSLGEQIGDAFDVDVGIGF